MQRVTQKSLGMIHIPPSEVMGNSWRPTRVQVLQWRLIIL